MSIFGKLKFWGKKGDFDKDLGLDLGPLPGEQPSDFGDPMNQPQPSFGQASQPPPLGQPMGQPVMQSPPPMEPVREEHDQQITLKNLEVISYKLDAIQALLNSINQRLNNLEAKEENRYRFKY